MNSMIYADLIRAMARALAQFDPQDRRALVEAVLKEALAHDQYRLKEQLTK